MNLQTMAASSGDRLGDAPADEGSGHAERDGWRHPEQPDAPGIEPTIGEELRYRQFLDALEKASEDDLRQLVPQMARQLMVVYPAAMRWLARSAAENLSGRGSFDAAALAAVVLKDLGHSQDA